MSVETSAFGQYFEYLPSCLDLVHMSKLEVVLQDVLLVVLSFAFSDNSPEFTLGDEILAVEVVLFLTVHF